MSEYIYEFEEYLQQGTYSQKRKEEIVRCRDCRHYEKLSDDKGVCHPLGIVFADMDDCFCAWGESAPRGRNFEIDEPDTIRNELEDNGYVVMPYHGGDAE